MLLGKQSYSLVSLPQTLNPSIQLLPLVKS